MVGGWGGRQADTSAVSAIGLFPHVSGILEFVCCIAAICRGVVCVEKNQVNVIKLFSSPSVFNSDSTVPALVYILRSLFNTLLHEALSDLPQHQ
jgi:hypothetical protein